MHAALVGAMCVYSLSCPHGSGEKLGADIQGSPASLVFCQCAPDDTVAHMNSKSPPTGLAQTFLWTHHHGLLIAAKATLAKVLRSVGVWTWSDVGTMQVVDVHWHKPVAGFQRLSVANVHAHSWGGSASHGTSDDASRGASTASMDEFVDIIVTKHVRLLVGDFSAALWALPAYIRGRGVELNVVAWSGATADDSQHIDPCAIFAVGPVDKVCKRISSLRQAQCVAQSTSRSLPLASYTHGSGGEHIAELIGEALEFKVGGDKTSLWPTLPMWKEKGGKVLTHDSTVSIAVMGFLGVNKSYRSPWRTEARNQRRIGRGRGSAIHHHGRGDARHGMIPWWSMAWWPPVRGGEGWLYH